MFQQVFHVFEAIELVVRRYLNFASLQAFELDTDLKQTILSEVLTCEAVMRHWEIIAKDIPVKLEEYSICLLRAIAEQWINVRGHSFAQGWTMKFEKRYERGTRKTLQQEREK